MKIRRCPHCHSQYKMGNGYYHDGKLNIRCARCNNIILATSEEDEQSLQKLYTRPLRDSYEHHTTSTTSNVHTHPVLNGFPNKHAMHRQNGCGPHGCSMMLDEMSSEYE